MKFLQNLKRFRNKARFKDKVLWRIPGDREFGCNDEFGAGRGQTFVGLKDLFEVTAQIPHGGIELGEADFHTAGRKLNAGEPAAIAFYLSSSYRAPRGACILCLWRCQRLPRKLLPTQRARRQGNRHLRSLGLSGRRWLARRFVSKESAADGCL